MLCFVYNMPFLLAPFKLKLSSEYEEDRTWIGQNLYRKLFIPTPPLSHCFSAIPSSVSEISNTTVENWLSAIRLSMPVRFKTKMWGKGSVQFHFRSMSEISNKSVEQIQCNSIKSMSEISNKRVEKA